MEQIYLKQLATSTPQGIAEDINSPFSFLEWKQRRPSVSEKDTIYHYNGYLLNWFDRNKQKQISQKFLLRQKYLYLLDQLQLFFTEEEKNIWYAKINLDDEKELLLAIPYFAKKLKDISLYYLKLRNKLKNTKLRYNTVGTPVAVEQQVYRYLMETFSSLNNELSSSLQTTVPQFSSLQQSLVVEIEELYDDHQYFDRSSTMPTSAYFDLFHDATEKYFETKGITLSSSEWLFNSLNLPVTANIDSFLQDLTGNIFETSDTNLYGSFIQNYLAENKYSLEFTAASSVTEVTEVPINEGNNSFYYPSGTVDASLSIKGRIPIVALSSIVPAGGTAGATIEESDTIFIKNGEDIQQAWLYYKEYDYSKETVKATLSQNTTTSFIFPYPGYGLSGVSLPWTGSDFETTAGYNFISQQLKANVNEVYWAQFLPPDNCESIMLNNTTLISSGAIASKNPTFSDQVRINDERTEDTTIPRGELSGAWLYKLEKSSLPISPNSSNVLLWPYITVDPDSEYDSYLNKISFKNACNAISIQDLDRTFCIAASAIDLADKIYKLNNFADTIDLSTECAWLSSKMISSELYSKSKQNGFSVLFPAGEITRFVWDGPETTLEEAFPSIPHQADCPFVTNTPSVSAFEWQKCSCKQVYYSPFGHSERQFQNSNNFADCVFEDTLNILEPTDFGSWRDSEGNNYLNSKEFVWYKTNSKHAWGNGSWVTNQLSATAFAPFNLEPGKAYFFYRSTSRTSSDSMPPYSVNYAYGTNDSVWVEAKIQEDGTWASTGRPSQLNVFPGDFIKYDRQQTTKSYLISSVEIENTTANENGSLWSVFDTIAVCAVGGATTISWPLQNYLPIDGFTDPLSAQYPLTSIIELTAVNAWKVTRDEDGSSQTMENMFVVTFAPPTTGTYSIAVTATTTGGQEVYADSQGSYGTIIPKITAISQFDEQDVFLDIDTPSNGFLIEQPLYGWNYNTNSAQTNSLGARPYWASLLLGKDSSTRFKGIYSWGYPNEYVDNYLPNHNPLISPLEVSYGSVVDYTRKGYQMKWDQPIDFQTYVGEAQWCQLSANVTNVSNLSSVYTTKQNQELTVFANTGATNITLTNIKNGLPVEVYYYALNSFTWPISVEVTQEVEAPDPQLFFESPTPWANLSNRFYPTVATVPVLEETYGSEDVGGYFTPDHLGASQFINKDFTTSLKTLNLSGTFLTEDESIHIGGRGRTKQDQDSLYKWEENNQWLKESPVSNQLAGSIKKSLTKTLQTFIPYQSKKDEAALGLVTTTSRTSPWGGPTADEWTDVANEPQSFTGVKNVSAWATSQVLKQNEKHVDFWTTDVFGNQYGLFKDLSGVPVSQRHDVEGELWVRTNDQKVNPAYKSLSAVFDLFDTEQDSAFYAQLTGQGIKTVDCFFNTLLIETSLSAVFIEITYDYEEARITATYDDIIKEPNNYVHRLDRTWFFPQFKKIVALFANRTSSSFCPELTELNLDTKSYKTIFPAVSSLDLQEILSPTTGIGSIVVDSLQDGCLHYNKTQQTYLITYYGKDISQKPFIIDFKVEQQDQATLKEINIYSDATTNNQVLEPPVVSSQFFNTFSVPLSTSTTIAVSATNNPTQYDVLNYLTNVTVTSAGIFTAYFETLGLYHVNYQVSNNIGSNIFCLTLSAS